MVNKWFVNDPNNELTYFERKPLTKDDYRKDPYFGPSIKELESQGIEDWYIENGKILFKAKLLITK